MNYRRNVSLASLLLLASATGVLWQGGKTQIQEGQAPRQGFAEERTLLSADLPGREITQTEAIIYGARQDGASASESAARSLREFDEWLGRYMEATPDVRQGLIAEGQRLAIARRSAMARLIREDPEQAIARSIPPDRQRLLPEAIAAELETRFDAHGDLDVVTVCDGDEAGHGHTVSRHLTLRAGRYEASVYGRRESQTTQYDLPVHGVMLDNAVAVHERPVRRLDWVETAASDAAPGEVALQMGEETVVVEDLESARIFEEQIVAAEGAAGPEAFHGIETTSTTASASSASWTTGEKRVLYIRVDFEDRPGAPLSQEAAERIMGEADAFFTSNSNGRTSLTTTVIPSTLRMNSGTDAYRSTGYMQLRDDALAAAREFDRQDGATGRFDPDQYDLYVLAFPSVFSGWGGRAAVGGRGVWLNGFFDSGITTHEIGHNFGLFHANVWEPSDAAPAGEGRHLEYADRFDVMGISSNVYNGRFQDGHLNSWFKAYLGWIEEEDVAHVQAEGTYRLYRHDHAESQGLRALTIPTGDGRAYWLGVRRLFDGNPWLMNGVDIRWGHTTSGLMSSKGSELLDMQPQSSGGFDDHALVVGEQFSDFNSEIHIRAVAMGGEGPGAYVDVEVAFGTAASPAISSDPVSQSAIEGQPVTFRVSANGTLPMEYQWLKDGAEIAGANGESLRIAAVSPEDAGLYSVRITNAHGSTTSKAATLTIIPEGSAMPGSVDGGFDSIEGPNGPVYSILPQPDGHVIIAGNFTSVAGVTRNRIARLRPDGSLDASFDPGSGFDNNVWCLALQPDGKVVAGGTFTSFDGLPRNRIVRLLPDGRPDMQFAAGEGANQAVRAIALEADGRIVVGGAFTTFDGIKQGGVTRLFANGALDSSFQTGAGADGAVWSLAIHDDGIYVGGAFSTFDGHGRSGIARLHDDGRVDAGFAPGTGANGAVYALLGERDGGVIAAGSFTSFDNESAHRIVRLTVAGGVDTAFAAGGGADDFIWSLGRQDDDKILAGGWFRAFGGEIRNGVSRLNRDGSLDASFDPGTGANDLAWPVAVQQDGAVLLGGRFTRFNESARSRIVRLHGDSTSASPSAEAESTYARWLNANEIAPEQSAPADDPGGLGVANVLRYAFGLDSRRPDRSQLPTAGRVESGSENYLTITFHRRKAQEDLLYVVEGSDDLAAWTPLSNAAEVEVIDAGETELVTVRDSIPASERARFLRVRVNLASE